MKLHPQRNPLRRRLMPLIAALTVFTVTVFGSIPKVSAANDTPLVSERDVIRKACELIGLPYKMGGKGSPDFTGMTLYPREEFESYGIDCSGLVFWTYVSLGVKLRHTNSALSWYNQFSMPVATYYWHDGTNAFNDFKFLVGDKTGTVRLIRDKGQSYDINYFNADKGGYITPGSVVVMKTEDPDDEHCWMYIGYAEGGKEGIKKLLKDKYGITDINDTDITYIASEGNHWRIESTAFARFCGQTVSFYGENGRYSVITPIYKDGVTVSNRRRSAGGICTGQFVFRIAGLPADPEEDDND